MGILAIISNALGAVAQYFGFQSAVQKRDNAADMIANANAKRDVAERDKIGADIAAGTKTGDLTQERKDFSDDA
jgi:hypothetical protein